MKSTVSVFLSLSLFLLLIVIPANAQNTNTLDAELIYGKIQRLESVDVKSKSPTVQDLYKQTLLRLYEDYRRALEQDLKDLQSIQAAIGESKRNAQSELSVQIRRLSDERDTTIEKITTLRGNVAANGASTEQDQTGGEPAPRSPMRRSNYTPEATNVSLLTTGASTESPATSRASVRLPLNNIPTPAFITNAAAAVDPPAATTVLANVDWETRTAGCPAKVTTSTTGIIRVTHINDLFVDFDSGDKFEYQLRAVGTPVSAVPTENPFAPQSGTPSKTFSSPADIVAALKRIRAYVQGNENLSRKSAGGKSISLRASFNAAKANDDIQAILILYSQNPQNPIFTAPEVAGHPVFQWMKLIDGSHSYDFTVVLEPDQNYEFTLTEKWKSERTAEGTKKWDCGEHDLFTLSLGPIISTLPMRTYNHQKALVPPGSSTTADILVVENTRNVSLLGGALLNYHFPHISGLPRTMGFALSAGPVYTFGGTPNVSALGLFVGPSIHLNRSVFITPGLHIGQFADFPAGFAPGTVIPNQFGDLNPVKRNTAHFAIGITYRTNSFKKTSTAAGTANNAASAGGQNKGNQSTTGSPGTGNPNPQD